MTKFIKKEGKVLLLSFFLLFFISLVIAVPPQASTEGWMIESAIKDGIKLNTDYDFHVHVFDVATGNPINTSTRCTLHLYDSTGHHQYEGNDDVVSHTYDYSWDVDAGNFTEAGTMPYVVQCNGTYGGESRGGFYSASFEITDSGEDLTEGKSFQNFAFFGFILALSLGVIILGLWKQDAPITIFGTFGLYFLGLYILFYGITGVKDTTTTWAAGIVTLGLAFYISIRASYELIRS